MDPPYVFTRTSASVKGLSVQGNGREQMSADSTDGQGLWGAADGGAGMALGAPRSGVALDHSTDHSTVVAASRFAYCCPLWPSPPLSPASGLGVWGRDLCPFSCRRD